MCGILCSASFVKGLDYDSAVNIIDYRGPDAADIKKFNYNSLEIVLGHRRLSIIDLDQRSNQPFCYANRYWITYNGEIYNYIELRRELKNLGYNFITDCDTEVIVVAYIHWNESFLEKLNGMFSFCIYDSYEKEFFIARDRYGIKPLYYLYNPGMGIYFSSEVKQLLALSVSEKKINHSSLLAYVLHGNFAFNCNTMISDINEFPESNYLKLKLDEQNIVRDALNFKQWYALPNSDFEGTTNIELYNETLNDAVRLRLRSDVKLGALLSGGIDSSMLALAMNKIGCDTVSYITARFSDNSFDESHYAISVAEELSLPLKLTHISNKNLISSIDETAFYFDHPVIGGSVIPHYLLYKEVAKNKIKVCLEGQGADESLFGYTSFQYAYLAELFKSIKLIKFIKELCNFSHNEDVSNLYVMKEVLARIAGQRSRLRTSERLASLVNVDISKLNFVDRRVSTLHEVLNSRFKILKSILQSVDRLSMASSVEARVPYLDHRVVELFINAPLDLKINNGYRKLILRKIMSGKLPQHVVNRKDKRGFNSPEHHWVKAELADYMRDYLSQSNQLEIFNSSTIINNFDNYIAGKSQYDPLYWRLFSVMKWKEVFRIP